MRKLTLFIPGFFGPKSETTLEAMPEIPSIENLFRFGSLSSKQKAGYIPTLFRLFGFSETDTEYPVAAITRLVDDGQDVEGIWMRADPVHLRAEREAVVMLDSTAFNLEKHEALILAADTQQVFTDRQFELEAPVNNRWYVKLPELPKIITTPIYEVVGHDINENMANGDDKILWDQIANEAQMSLHNCPLNHEREQTNNLPINGLWCWGAGTLPEAPKPQWSRVFGDEVTVEGMSTLTNTPYVELPDTIEAVINHSELNDNVLAVMAFGLRHQQYYDHEGWQDFIAYLEDEWFVDIEKLLNEKEISEFNLVTDNNTLMLNKKSLKKFWRRKKSLINFQ